MGAVVWTAVTPGETARRTPASVPRGISGARSCAKQPLIPPATSFSNQSQHVPCRAAVGASWRQAQLTACHPRQRIHAAGEVQCQLCGQCNVGSVERVKESITRRRRGVERIVGVRAYPAVHCHRRRTGEANAGRRILHDGLCRIATESACAMIGSSPILLRDGYDAVDDGQLQLRHRPQGTNGKSGEPHAPRRLRVISYYVHDCPSADRRCRRERLRCKPVQYARVKRHWRMANRI